MADWAEGLPTLLMANIMDRLDLVDCVRSTAVCRAWRSAYADTRRRRGLHDDPRQVAIPDMAAEVCRFIPANGHEGEEFRVALPVKPSTRWSGCLGSSEGWVFIFDDASKLYMWNPLSGSLVQLPALATFPGVTPIRDSGGHLTHYDVLYINYYRTTVQETFPIEEACRTFFHKVIAFRSSPTSSSYMVAAIHGPLRQLALARPGDTSWTVVKTRATCFLSIRPVVGGLTASGPEGIVQLRCDPSGYSFTFLEGDLDLDCTGDFNIDYLISYSGDPRTDFDDVMCYEPLPNDPTAFWFVPRCSEDGPCR